MAGVQGSPRCASPAIVLRVFNKAGMVFRSGLSVSVVLNYGVHSDIDRYRKTA